jgi:hypothetical protein
MSSLRKIIDGYITSENKPKPEMPLKQGDQVVLRKPLQSRGRGISEILVGTIAAFSDDGSKALLSIPRAGGRILRANVPVVQLSHVSDHYKVVPTNPAFRRNY